MGVRTGYEAGTFCWVDLATTDPEDARAFYGDLFGWEAEDIVGGDGGAYTMLRLGGDDVAALYEMEEERREAGVRAHWFSYVSVEDADATVARARELGGAVYGEPRDAAEMGRMAVIGDPEGGVLGAWQAGTFFGARRVNDPGCLTWNELQTREPEATPAFYSGLFGWEPQPIEQDGSLVYVSIQNAGASNGGFMPMTEAHGDAAPYWLAYFAVASCDDAVARVRALGGSVLAEPFDLPSGRISVVGDPQGAAFAFFEGETDD